MARRRDNIILIMDFKLKQNFFARFAYKLKHWLVQNNGISSYDSSVLSKNCSDKNDAESEM